MRISSLGEFGLINRIKRSIHTDASVIKPIGDDCAVLRLDKDKYQLFTCDLLVEGVDFFPNEKPYLIGRKALAEAISDIAACAGIPRYCLLSLGMPKATSVEFVDGLYRGIRSLADKYRINIVGGDISRAGQLILDISVLGIVEKKRLVLRSGAKKGDIILVTGELGGSISGKHLRFTPRIKEARFLSKNFKVNAMLDISDGLVQDLSHILSESNMGAIIYEGLIPLSKQARGLRDALYMGEDFELLFTMPRSEANRLLSRRPAIFRPIGEITAKRLGLRLVDKKGRQKALRPGGFRHF